uniref:Uncharacterized protein n=1 Tax=Meloidogyne floridensis TaxID=298350 RepID=A0A915P481_9BILA
MLSSSIKICLFLVLIFVLFQLNNAQFGCAGAHHPCSEGGYGCCSGLKCNVRGI